MSYNCSIKSVNKTNMKNEQRDAEHLILIAMLYATNLQMKSYLAAAKPAQRFKQALNRCQLAIKETQKMLSLDFGTLDTSEILADAASGSGSIIYDFSRFAAMIPEQNLDQMHDILQVIYAEIGKNVPPHILKLIGIELVVPS